MKKQYFDIKQNNKIVRIIIIILILKPISFFSNTSGMYK